MAEKIFSKLQIDGHKLNQARQSFVPLEQSDGRIKILLSSANLFSLNEDLPGNFGNSSIYLYAENLFLSQTLKAKNITISANTFTTARDALLDVSGNNGENATAKPDDPSGGKANAGNESTDGSKSGDVFLYVENFDHQLRHESYFDIRARGGDGGRGLGGGGGKGGDGGNVRIFVSHPIVILFEEISSIHHLNDIDKKRSQIRSLLTKFQFFSLKEISNAIKALSKVTESSEDRINACLEKLIEELGDLYESCKSWRRVQESIYIHVEGGARGTGASFGANGSAGSKICELNPMDSLDRFDKLFVTHPLQCAMFFNKLKLEYMFLDPTDIAKREQISELFNRLKIRTRPFTQLDATFKVPEEYQEQERITNALANISFFKSISNETSKYLDSLKNGYDVFGYNNKYVHLISIKHMKDEFLEPLFNNFVDIHQSFNECTKKDRDRQEKLKIARKIHDSASSKLAKSSIQETILENDIIKSANLIDEYQREIPAKKEEAEKMIKTYRDTISSHFDFEIEDLLHAMSTIAFAPKSVAMWASQGVEFIYSGANNITDDSGRKVRKEYLVRKVKKTESNLKSLAEGFKIGEGGTIKLDDPGADKLLAKQEELNQQLDDFYSKFPKETVRVQEAFKDYAEAVIGRNTAILNYNNCMELMVQMKQDKQYASEQIDKVNDALLKEKDFDDIQELVSDVYYSLRDDVLHAVFIAEKAYKLHTLDLKNIFTNALHDTDFNEIASNMISAKLTTHILNYEISHPRSPNTFEGVHYILKGRELDNLRNYGQLRFQIDPDKLEDHPESKGFMQWREIRVSRVSPYIKGIKLPNNSNSEILITIIHGEEDVFIRNDSSRLELIHQPVSSSFDYDLDDPSKIITYGDFLFEGDKGEKIPLLGPFTNWNIQIRDYENMDLSGVTDVDIVFDGVHFDQ